MVQAVDVIVFFAVVVLPIGILFLALFCVARAAREDADEALSAPVVQPEFRYAQARASAEPPLLCVICLEELRQGQLCSEVLACRHLFHVACIRVWAKKMNSCPLCRVRIVPGTAQGVPAADDIV